MMLSFNDNLTCDVPAVLYRLSKYNRFARKCLRVCTHDESIAWHRRRRARAHARNGKHNYATRTLNMRAHTYSVDSIIRRSAARVNACANGKCNSVSHDLFTQFKKVLSTLLFVVNFCLPPWDSACGRKNRESVFRKRRRASRTTQ